MNKKFSKTISLSFLIMTFTLLSSCSQSIFDVADRYKTVFWFNETTSRALLDDNADSLFIYVNYKLVASTAVDDIFWATAPSCDDNTAITKEIDLLRKENPIIVSVKDQTGFVYFNKSQSLTTNSCNAIEIGPITDFK